MRHLLTCFLVMILTALSLHAQNRALKNRFNAGVVLGVNTSQIDGDQYMGYDKFGFFAGIRGIARFTKKSELVIEMLYNRKGSRDPDQLVPGTSSGRFISLDYIEVPILFHLKVDGKLGAGGLEFGISYGQLFGARIKEHINNINFPSFAAIRDDFNNDDLALIIGGGVFLNDHIRLMARLNYSLNYLYESDLPSDFLVDNPLEIRAMRNLQLGLGINYIFK